jgi:hypothetical protein
MICTVSLTILKPDDSPLAGESVSARVASANTDAETDADGKAQWM